MNLTLHSNIIIESRDLLINNLNLYILFINFQQYPIIEEANKKYNINADKLIYLLDKLYQSETENIEFTIDESLDLFTVTDIMCKLLLLDDVELLIKEIYSMVNNPNKETFAEFRSDMLKFNENFLNNCKANLASHFELIERINWLRNIKV